MDLKKIFNLLEKYRLEKYYNAFLELGIEDERDFKDSVTKDNLNTLGFSQMEKNRFESLVDYLKQLGSSRDPEARPLIRKHLEDYYLKYRTPKSSETKIIRGLDPSQNTILDLILRMCHLENLEKDMTVCLFSHEGIPLTDDPFFNTWSLNDRNIENGSEIYAIFTLKQNVRHELQIDKGHFPASSGEDSIRCHIMLKEDYEIKVDLSNDSLKDLKMKLFAETGISPAVLHAKVTTGDRTQSLDELGIQNDSVIHFSLSSFAPEKERVENNFIADILPAVKQSEKGRSVFFSTLYVVSRKNGGNQFKKVIALIRKLSVCNALAQSLHQIICKNEVVSTTQKIAVVEGLYNLFRELLPSDKKRMGSERIIEDHEVFEQAALCWAYIINAAQTESIAHEQYAPISLTCQGSGEHLCEPVRIPGIQTVFDRKYVMQKISDGEKIEGCTEKNLQSFHLTRAIDVERILLCLPPSRNSFPLWISSDFVITQNFQINSTMSFAEMCENQNKPDFSHLLVTPPLMLKNIGLQGPLLVLLSKDNLGVYLEKDKMYPNIIKVFNTMNGKQENVDADTLAKNTEDKRIDQSIKASRSPVEAILVLMDSSSSMASECYDDQIKMKRIDAIKQMFHAFANRSMAYNFHHVIGLVRFGGKIEILHTFTEIFETFKEYIDNLEAKGCTKLYDALDYSIKELKGIKQQFPECSLRILCLTDGNDVGSSSNPVQTAVKLIDSKIVVDSVIIGEVENYVLHGISNVTGGCCFKPSSSENALKIFEMETVLSMKDRKPKRKYEASSISTLNHLTGIFAKYGYDNHPEAELPKEINGKMTLAHKVVKKKSKDFKTGKVMEKDRRIIEELRSLHCSPHPYYKVFPSETDMTFWQILLLGPPDTPYENGVFLLYCKFEDEYPQKPPLVRFITPIYHCNVNSVGRICHQIFDRNYSAHITMKEVLEAVYGLLIAPEPEDPLDSILAEEYLSSKGKYLEQARKTTADYASTSLEDMEKKLVDMDLADDNAPSHLVCKLTKKMFDDPVKTPYGNIYECRAIEKHLKQRNVDPSNNKPLCQAELKPSLEMRRMVEQYRRNQIKETAL